MIISFNLFFCKFCFSILLICLSLTVSGQLGNRYCGDEGIWIQTLGSGDLDIENDRGAESYLVWIDTRATLLVNAGAGTSVFFDESNAKFSDLQAIVLSQTSVNRTSDLAALLKGSRRSYREDPLTILGPEGDEHNLSTSDFVNRLLSKEGPYPELAPLLTVRSPNGYQIRTRDVPIGSKRWSGFGTSEIILSAMAMKAGGRPSLAWRISIADRTIVFVMGPNNRKHTMAEFAEEADAIVFSHLLPVGSPSLLAESNFLPSQIAFIASHAQASFILLGGRNWRTLGRETRTLEEIEKDYDGTIIFPDDLECWGIDRSFN